MSPNQIARWASIVSGVAALAAAAFWFLSAAGEVPPMLQYWDKAPPEDPFYRAFVASVRMNRIAALLTGASVLSGALAMWIEKRAQRGTAAPHELHAKLWKLIASKGIYVKANARSTTLDLDPREQGSFYANLYGHGPAIQLWRTRADSVDDYTQELITLAHEYGHGISHSHGQRPLIDMPKPSPDLTEEQKQMVEAEEARAWKYGREVLIDLSGGMYAFALFDKRKRDADAVYAQKLGR